MHDIRGSVAGLPCNQIVWDQIWCEYVHRKTVCKIHCLQVVVAACGSAFFGQEFALYLGVVLMYR